MELWQLEVLDAWQMMVTLLASLKFFFGVIFCEKSENPKIFLLSDLLCQPEKPETFLLNDLLCQPEKPETFL